MNHHNHSNFDHHRLPLMGGSAAVVAPFSPTRSNLGGGGSFITTTTKQFALKAVEAAVSESSPEVLQACVSRLTNVNECILKSSPQKKYGYVSSSGLLHTVEAIATKQHHFSVLHLQLFMWMVESSVNFLRPSFYKALEKQILKVAMAGGDCDIQVQGIRVLCGEEEIFRLHRKTITEFIHEFVQRSESPNDEMLNSQTRRILKVIGRAKVSNPISSFDTSHAAAAVWSNLLFSEDFSDVKFVCCTDRTTFPAHQCVLSGASPYFRQYFKGPWSKQKGDKQYETRVDSTIIKHILTYMYTGTFGNTSIAGMSVNTVIDILQTAQEFQMARLVEVCCKIIGPRINLQNIKKVTCVASTIVTPPTLKAHPMHHQLQQHQDQHHPNNDHLFGNDGSNGIDHQYGHHQTTNLWKCCAEFIKDNSTQVLLHQDFCLLSSENPHLWNDLQTEISKCLTKKTRRQQRKRRRRNDDDWSDEDDDYDDGDNDHSTEDMSSDSE